MSDDISGRGCSIVCIFNLNEAGRILVLQNIERMARRHADADISGEIWALKDVIEIVHHLGRIGRIPVRERVERGAGRAG